MSTQKAAVREVFRSTGQPDVTYVAREGGQFEEELASQLQHTGNTCLLYGPSKSGKTTLYNKVISDIKKVPLLVRCDNGLDAVQFWSRALESIQFDRVSEVQAEHAVKSSIGAKIGTKLGWSWLAEATGEMSASAAAEASEAEIKKRVLANPSAQHLVRALTDLPLVLVVEDFHYLSASVKETIFQQWKVFIDNSIPVIVVSTGDNAQSLLELNKDLEFRYVTINVGSWKSEDLEKIVDQGFRHLNVKITDLHKKIIARESLGMPILTQQICSEIFTSSGAYEIGHDDKFEVRIEKIQAALNSTAERYYSGLRDYYQKLIAGPRKNARVYNTYKLILLSFAQSPVKFDLSKEDIIERLGQVKAEARPPRPSINSTLAALTKFQERKQFYVLRWDAEREKLYLIEPALLFYARWHRGSGVALEYSVSDVVSVFQSLVNAILETNQKAR